MFLLDTVVLSELRKPPQRRNRHLVEWLGQTRSTDLYLSVLTIGEIERGIERRRQIDAAFAQRLAAWLDAVLRLYDKRILEVDLPAARRWGRLSQQIGNKGLD